MSDPAHERDAPASTSPRSAIISAIIPCLDEEAAIAQVVSGVLAQNVSDVVVVDGGSRDKTVDEATGAGARVIVEPRRGYGRAIQAGIAAVRKDADIVVFLDGDGSDPVEFIPRLVSPIIAGQAVFVLGSRVRGARERGSLAPQQVIAAYVGRLLLRLVYGARFTDLSPYRAIRRDVLDRLGMSGHSVSKASTVPRQIRLAQVLDQLRVVESNGISNAKLAPMAENGRVNSAPNCFASA